MTLNVSVEPGRVPRVVLSGIDGPVVGRAGGREWVVTEGAVGFPIVDPLAPLGVPVTYESGGESTSPVVLESLARDAIMAPDGSQVVECFRANSHDLELDRGVATLWPKGASVPWVLHPEKSGAFTGPLNIVTGAEGADTLASLLTVSSPVVVKHNPTRCPIRHCRVAPVMVVTVTNAVDKYAGYDEDGWVSDWSLTVVPDRLSAVVPARAWWHTMAENDTWFGVDLIGEAFL